ncbi:MAG TPA: FAD-dependent oxidoreductase, partial [Vicinamibacterales bacterium]
PRIVIIGAGPTGLGAAWRLHELGNQNWSLYESTDHPGGLASSVIDNQGFTWDLGGHVLFSHYKYFDNVMDTALGDAWIEHVREAWVWIRDRWVPYPFQNNIWRLPNDELIACLSGLVDLQGAPRNKPPSFRDWLLQSFGAGLCDTFMLPYNRKVWAYDPSRLDVGWMGERVATVDLKRILTNVVLRRDDVGWGPNSTFRFPAHGGTGAIWRAVAARLPAAQIHFRRTVSQIDLEKRRLTMADGESIGYDVLISTMPLDHLLRSIHGRPELTGMASTLVYSSSHIVGIGMAGTQPADLRSKCWIYFPEDKVPFYRATVFSNYSPNNVPTSSPHWSLMAEVSESPDKPVEQEGLIADVIAGFLACGFIDPAAIVTSWHRRLDHGYPTPWLGRDAVLAPIEKTLRAADVLSRGRFGAWKYEVSNQDHSFMQGVEAVNNVLQGTPEPTFGGSESG